MRVASTLFILVCHCIPRYSHAWMVSTSSLFSVVDISGCPCLHIHACTAPDLTCTALHPKRSPFTVNFD